MFRRLSLEGIMDHSLQSGGAQWKAIPAVRLNTTLVSIKLNNASDDDSRQCLPKRDSGVRLRY